MTRIRSIACALPETEVTNADLDRANPSWGMEQVAAVSGVYSRRVAATDETALDLSVRACEELLGKSNVAAADIDAILYCTHDPDYPMPGNAHLLHAQLGLGERVLALDYRLACSGFVYGLGLADALVRSGLGSEVLLVTAETQSKHISARDRSVGALLGDGAAVTWLSANGDAGGRIVACDLRTQGRRVADLYVPAGGARRPSSEETRQPTEDDSGNVRSLEDMYMDGARVLAFVRSVVPAEIKAFLAERSLGLDDIDLLILHQASKIALDTLAGELGVPPEKLYRHMSDIGNLSSASIPFALRAALHDGAIGDGDRVLLSGFGAGASYGSVIVEF